MRKHIVSVSQYAILRSCPVTHCWHPFSFPTTEHFQNTAKSLRTGFPNSLTRPVVAVAVLQAGEQASEPGCQVLPLVHHCPNQPQIWRLALRQAWRSSVSKLLAAQACTLRGGKALGHLQPPQAHLRHLIRK